MGERAQARGGEEGMVDAYIDYRLAVSSRRHTQEWRKGGRWCVEGGNPIPLGLRANPSALIRPSFSPGSVARIPDFPAVFEKSLDDSLLSTLCSPTALRVGDFPRLQIPDSRIVPL